MRVRVPACQLVAWRVRMQERVCEQLGEPSDPSSAGDSGRGASGSQWSASLRGPTYTLVLDCDGLRPYHFGRASRRALSSLTHTLTHYYPDLVGQTLVVNAPGFLTATWGVVRRLMPAWWGVHIHRSLAELEEMEGICLHD